MAPPREDPPTDPELWAAVLRQMPVGVVVAEPSGDRVLLVSDEVARLHGRVVVNPGDRVSLADWSAFAPDGSASGSGQWPLDRVLAGEEQIRGAEVDVLRADGTLAVLRVSAARIHASNGAFLAAVCVSEDVTARARTESGVRISEERYRSLAAATAAVVWTASGDGLLVTPQEAWEAYTGQSFETAAGHGWLAGIHADDRERVTREWHEGTAARRPFQTRGRLWHAASGDWHHFVARSVPVPDPVLGVREWVTMLEDVEEQVRVQREMRELEARVQRAQKLESLSVLAGGVAHDFNNLLVGVIGNAEMALTDLPPDAPLRESLEAIRTAGLRAAELSGQMLAYSGKARYVAAPMDLNGVVADMRPLLDASVSRKARLAVALSPRSLPVEADAAQLRQVVLNLVVNASEALEDREGTITLATGAEEVREAVEPGPAGIELPFGRYAWLEVADTGTGMSPEIRARVFEPFFSTRFTGRGLGLAAVLGIVRSHGGTVRVQSEPGRGSTFRVLLPCCPDEAMAPAPRPQAPVPAGRAGPDGVVLVVDDEELVRTALQRIFELHGHTVVTASDGDEGLARVRELGDRVRVVVLDVTMPGRGGHDTCNELRRVRPELPILLASGYSEQDVMALHEGDPMVEFVPKPFDFPRLLRRIATLAGS